jgi:hypothetical protein
MSTSQILNNLGLKVGDWVEVRAEAEILVTLDKNGRLDELPFMPQMLEYCGQKFQVTKRVHKLCCIVADTIGRQLTNTVILGDLRCGGQQHGGCEMACTILWKEAWLRPLDPAGRRLGPEYGHAPSRGCSVADVIAGTRSREAGAESHEPVYVCQATQLPRATQPLSLWSLGQYYEDYKSGNVGVFKILSRLSFLVYSNLASSGLGMGSVLRWMHDRLQSLRKQPPYPWRRGALPKNSPTPSIDLNIQVGDVVRVKDYSNIRLTIDENGKNRGMSFHPELSRHCGKTFRVLHRVGKVMNEGTGKLIVLKNECLILDGANCDGEYTNPLGCPRGAYPYWRQIWLEKVSRNEPSPPEHTAPSAARGGTAEGAGGRPR